MENDIEQARASNMEEDKASSPNNGKYIDEGNASDIEMATNIVEKLDNELSRVPKPLRDVNSSRASNMENDIEQARASNMENDIEEARASNMENDIEEARATNMEEDKASSANKGKYIEMAKDIVKKLDNEVRLSTGSFQPNSSESRRSECCICRVPDSFRNVKPEAYTPQRISIGPLHRGNERLEAMEKEKLKYYKELRERRGMHFNRSFSKKMFDIVISIKKQEERLRNCYSQKFDEIKSNDFVEMILLDAVFIIQFFLESIDEKGPKSCKPRMTIFDIREDLRLLENQLPLSIIDKIYDQVKYSPRLMGLGLVLRIYKHKSFLDLATCYLREYLHLQGVETSPGVKRSGHITDLLRNLMLCKTSPDVEKETSLGEKIEHLTDLVRHFMLKGSIERSYSFDPVKLKYSAVMLRKAGVTFQVTRHECLVNIKFEKGVLKIPHLKVDDNFERLVRNIMAMEQCLYKREAYICSYIKFMDHLIDSAEDVGLLVENGIILNSLGDDATVANMINNLCKNIGDNDTCFGDISKELNAHYENPGNHRNAQLLKPLKLVYFPNMWTGMGTVAAAILLILTLIQTIKAFL